MLIHVHASTATSNDKKVRQLTDKLEFIKESIRRLEKELVDDDTLTPSDISIVRFDILELEKKQKIVQDKLKTVK
jgi:hypothetical protein